MKESTQFILILMTMALVVLSGISSSHESIEQSELEGRRLAQAVAKIKEVNKNSRRECPLNKEYCRR